MPRRLQGLDPVALTLPYLTTHPYVVTALGGGDIGDHISARNEPPYPHIRLLDPPGNDLDLRHLLAPVMQIEVHGDLDGSHGKPFLRDILYAVLEALVDMPNQPQINPTAPVITAVGSTGGGGWSPEPTGQPRYLATVQIHMHPGAQIP